MPSVVSMPPNMSTAALETISSGLRPAASAPDPGRARPARGMGRAASASSEAPAPVLATARNSSLSCPNAATPAVTPGVAGRAAPGLAAASCETAPTIASYQARMVAGGTWPRPRTRATTATASGAARLRLRSPRPAGRIALTRRSASPVTNASS